MNIQEFKHPCEYAIIEDVYSSHELELLWQEIDFLSTKLLSPDKTNSAIEDNKILKQAVGIFLDDFYTDRKASNILQLNRYIWQEQITSFLEKNLSSWWRLLKMSDKDSTLLNYYSDSDHYKLHTDLCIFTTSMVLYKTPLNFIGGDFILLDKLIALKNNSTIIFPGHVPHAVTPVRLINNSIKNSGRYSLVQFISINI